jgi:hypothetical protein
MDGYIDYLPEEVLFINHAPLVDEVLRHYGNGVQDAKSEGKYHGGLVLIGDEFRGVDLSVSERKYRRVLEEFGKRNYSKPGKLKRVLDRAFIGDRGKRDFDYALSFSPEEGYSLRGYQSYVEGLSTRHMPEDVAEELKLIKGLMEDDDEVVLGTRLGAAYNFSARDESNVAIYMSETGRCAITLRGGRVEPAGTVFKKEDDGIFLSYQDMGRGYLEHQAKKRAERRYRKLKINEVGTNDLDCVIPMDNEIGEVVNF